MRLSLTILFFIISLSALIGQDEVMPMEVGGCTDFESCEKELSALAEIMRDSPIADEKVKACHQFIPLLVKTLKFDGSYRYPFDSLVTISKLKSSDDAFRIITWELQLSKSKYRQYGVIQMNSGELELFPLMDKSDDILRPSYKSLDADNWYGALYYRILSRGKGKKKHYLLFGRDSNNFLERIKVVDVLWFDKGTPKFGKTIFTEEKPDPRKAPIKRIVFQYSANAHAGLNYRDDLKMIIHDHLIPLGGARGAEFVPDGSYVGYKYKKGKWMKVKKVYDQVSISPPMPSPVLGKGKTRLYENRKKEK